MDSTKGNARRRILSLRVLFFLGHLPLVTFALGITAATAVMVGVIHREVREGTAGLAEGAPTRVAVEGLASTFVSMWESSLVGFFVFGALGIALIECSQRSLSARIRRIVQHAERIGDGRGTSDLRPEADDALGSLEAALVKVADTLEARDAVRLAEHRARDQIGRVQRAMSMVDSEADAHRLVQRALRQLTPGQPAELLMAANADGPLLPVAQSPGVAAPQCGVPGAQKCPAIQQGTTLQFPDGEALDACQRLQDRETPCAALCIPVTVMGRTIGVLHTIRPNGRPPEGGTVAALETLTSTYGARVGLLRTLESTQRQAGTDALTGLPNRRHIDEKVTQMMASSASACVVMADLDKFKLLNDTYGHAVGDLALQRFAQVLRASTRPGDVFGRWGGEEFFLMLPECSAHDARGVLDRLRTNLSRQSGSGGVPPFTASFGVAEFPRNSVSFDELVQLADKALYRAKEQGRDRVEFGGDLRDEAVTPA